jgi:hypothetical protein
MSISVPLLKDKQQGFSSISGYKTEILLSGIGRATACLEQPVQGKAARGELRGRRRPEK